MEALIHWDCFISAVPRFLAYIIACVVPALAEVGGKVRFGVMLLFRWHVRGPGSRMGSPGCCKAPIQETWFTTDPKVAREFRGPVNTKGLESGAKWSERRLSGAGHLGRIGAGAALHRLSSPHSYLSALAWDRERRRVLPVAA